jgi:hypothetical protein
MYSNVVYLDKSICHLKGQADRDDPQVPTEGLPVFPIVR